MGKTDPTNPSAYKQQSVILVPAGAPGVTVQRALSVYGYDGKAPDSTDRAVLT